MCRRIECPRCGRPGFAGCGAHVEQVLGDVRPQDRCACGSARASSRAASGSESGANSEGAGSSWLRNLFGR